MHYTQELAEYNILSIFYIMYIKHRIIQYKIINVNKRCSGRNTDAKLKVKS